MMAHTAAGSESGSRADETRRRLVEAAVDLFREHGYGSTSMSQVAAAAGSSRANLYLYFHSKAEIVLEWMHTLRPEFDQIYLQLDQLPDHSPESCHSWLKSMAGFWRSHPTEFEAMEQAMSEDSVVHRHRVEMHRRTVATFASLRPGAADGAIPATDDRTRESHVLSLMLGTERCLSALILHNAIPDEDSLLEALAHQWSNLLASEGG